MAYYLDVAWAETLRRHAYRPRAAEFGSAEMARWYLPRDALGWSDKRLIPETGSLAEIVHRSLAESGLDRRDDTTSPV